MFHRKDIDASAELGSLDGERGPAVIDEGRKAAPRGSRAFLLIFGCAAIAGTVAMTWKALQVQAPTSQSSSARTETAQIGNTLPALSLPPPRPEPPPAPKPAEIPASVVPQLAPSSVFAPLVAAPAQDAVRERRLSSGLTAKGSESARPPSSRAVEAEPDSGGLADQLRPVRVQTSRARLQGNRDLLLTEGTSIDCALNTRVISTQSGNVTCHLTRDVYSANGRVVLLDSGSKASGFYTGGITQGQARIFMQWSKVETPAGVVIDLDSTGAGPLGEAGVGGYVDRHLAERFGGAVMISLIGDVGSWLSNRSSQGSDNVQFNSTTQGAENAAAEALRNSINIPPTLYKNHGERVTIMVARNLDFSGVYRIEPKP